MAGRKTWAPSGSAEPGTTRAVCFICMGSTSRDEMMHSEILLVLMLLVAKRVWVEGAN